MGWKKDIVSAPQEFLKGRLHEAVVDGDGAVIALCGENAQVATMLSETENLMVRAKRLIAASVEYENFVGSDYEEAAESNLNFARKEMILTIARAEGKAI